MPASLTQKEFSKHLNTRFRVQPEAQTVVELELIEVQEYAGAPDEQRRMERFSVFFKGPGTTPLPQQTYLLQHEGMGEFEIFLVPVGRDENGFRYEAVFNYFKDK